MSLTAITADQVIHRLGEFDTLIDARSEGEFDEDHLPEAVNWPTLNNQERILIGTTYKQVNAFEAKKRGAALAACNIAAHIERYCLDKPKDWKPLTYCWRGGKRRDKRSSAHSRNKWSRWRAAVQRRSRRRRRWLNYHSLFKRCGGGVWLCCRRWRRWRRFRD